MHNRNVTLKKYGKKALEWANVRAAWIRANPPSHEGHYVCGICGTSVHISDMELDHIISRSSSPASFADWDNLQPTHSLCNRRKGSLHLQPVVSKGEYELRKQLNL